MITITNKLELEFLKAVEQDYEKLFFANKWKFYYQMENLIYYLSNTSEIINIYQTYFKINANSKLMHKSILTEYSKMYTRLLRYAEINKTDTKINSEISKLSTLFKSNNSSMVDLGFMQLKRIYKKYINDNIINNNGKFFDYDDDLIEKIDNLKKTIKSL